MDNKTHIRFYSGLDTIGGVIMEIVYNNERILLEAGTAFNSDLDVFDGSVTTRKNHLKDRLWTGDLPAIEGVFDQQYLEGTSLQSAQESNLHTSMFISHLHLDHMGNVGFFSDEVDIYMSKPAQEIFTSLQNCDEGIYNIHHHFLDMPAEIQIGDIFVKPFVINGFSYQDYSFVIQTPDLKLHYTGDVFVYGVYEEGIKKELEYLKQTGVDILVCEGTSFLPSWLAATEPANGFEPKLHDLKGVISEEEMLAYGQKSIEQYDGLIIFNIYIRELSHIQNWLDYEEKTGRQCIWEPKTAYIMNNYYHQSFKVCIPEGYDETHYPDYLYEVLKSNEIISKEEILTHPEQYMVQNSYENILELFDYRNVKTKYIHHSGTPLGSYEPSYEKMMMILEKCNIEYCYLYDTPNGTFYPHAIANQLLWYIQEVNPKLLIPSHCPNRQLEGQKAKRPYFLCENKADYIYDEKENTLKEVL